MSDHHAYIDRESTEGLICSTAFPPHYSSNPSSPAISFNRCPGFSSAYMHHCSMTNACNFVWDVQVT